MNERDDQDWAVRLAGRESGEADSHTAREAQALRQAVLDLERSQAPADPAALDRLIFRLRQEGLLEQPARTAARPWSWQFALAASLTALAVGAVLVAGLWFVPSTPPADTINVSARVILIHQSATPHESRDDLAQAMANAGILARKVDQDGRPELDVKVPAAGRESLQPLLSLYGLAVPASAEFTIEFHHRP